MAPIRRRRPERAVTNTRMLPPVISEGVASLSAGALRPALSVLALLDAAGTVLSWEMAASRIRVTERLTYERVDRLIAVGGGAPALGQAVGEAAVTPEAIPSAQA